MARLTVPAIATCMMAFTAVSQTSSLRGPVSGILYDAPSQSIRPVVGFPGASYLGKATLSGLDAAAISPDGDAALVEENGQVLLIRGLQSQAPVRIQVPELADPVDLIAWAANSGALVVYGASTKRMLRLDIKSSPPIASPLFDLSNLAGTVSSVATNRDGSQTVISVADPVQGGFYAVSDGASPVQLSATGNPGQAIFSASAQAVYAIDLDAKQILHFPQGINGGWEVLSMEAQSLVGLALSTSGQTLYLADGAAKTVRAYGLNTHTMLGEIKLDVAPQGLSPLAATANVFMLGARTGSGQPIWVLDARTVPAVMFIPAWE